VRLPAPLSIARNSLIPRRQSKAAPSLATRWLRHTADGNQAGFMSGLVNDPITGLTADLNAVFA